MAASTSRAMSSTQCATTPSLHALRNTPMKLLFVRVALVPEPRMDFPLRHDCGGTSNLRLHLLSGRVLRRRGGMYRVSFSRRILGLPFTITSVVIQSARNSERALRAAQLRFMPWSRIPDWRVRADEAKVEPLGSVFR